MSGIKNRHMPYPPAVTKINFTFSTESKIAADSCGAVTLH